MTTLQSVRAPKRTRSLAARYALALPLLLGACGYNTIQSYDEAAAQAKQNIDTQLQRRNDLIGNLVATFGDRSWAKAKAVVTHSRIAQAARHKELLFNRQSAVRHGRAAGRQPGR